MNIGDWVYSYSKGIWQIIRITDVDVLFPTKNSQTLIFCKRLINENGKRSFSVESVHPSLVAPISTKDKGFVESFITENPKIFKEFNAFHKPVDSILNLAFYVKNYLEREQFKKLIEDKFDAIENGLTETEIVKVLANKMGEERSSIRNITAQFISTDSEVVQKKFIYRRVDVLDF